MHESNQRRTNVCREIARAVASQDRRSHFQEALFTTSVRRCAAFEKRFQGLEPDADEFAGGFARSKTPGADLPFDVTRCAAKKSRCFLFREDCRIYRFDGRILSSHWIDPSLKAAFHGSPARHC